MIEDLQLYNFVSFEDTPVKVVEIKEHSVNIIFLGEIYEIEHFSALDLTEEYLEKLGFKQEGLEWKHSQGINLMQQDDLSWLLYSHNIKLNYVHSLQNIFKLLTDYSLTFYEY